MKFDIIIMNPPYNPNAVWSKFVVLAMDTLKEDGRLVAIHPAIWRESTKYADLAAELKQGIVELHLMDYEAFEIVAQKTDWYIWKKNYNAEQTIIYSNGRKTILDIKNTKWILRIPVDSIPAKILCKITLQKDNGCFLLGRNGYHPLYKKHKLNAKYKQCGGMEGNATKWPDGIFGLTDEPSEHQFLDKVVMCYSGKPRATFFSSTDEVGVVRAHYWLTDNRSLVTFLNSKMFWKVVNSVRDPDKGMRKPYGTAGEHPAWLLKSLNFEGLTATNEQELYAHYGLTQEEIDWCEKIT